MSASTVATMERRTHLARPRYREEPCKSALTRVTGMPFRWSLNPYVGCAHRCTFCYVRGFEQRAQRASGEGYGASIRVKTNLVEVLGGELRRRSWRREAVAMGTGTDPYQPAEGEYRLTRGCIRALGAARTPFSIVTRGPLIVRDIDVLQEAARRVEVTVHFSVPTLDRAIWRHTEPGTAPPHQRLRAVRALVDAGIRAGVGMAPLIPGLTDRPEQLVKVARAARDHGATHLWSRTLYLAPGTREHFLGELARVWPEEAERLDGLYRTAYLDRAREDAVHDRVASVIGEADIADRRTHAIEPDPPDIQLGLWGTPSEARPGRDARIERGLMPSARPPR